MAILGDIDNFNFVEEKPTRCIDPIMKFCQECRYGWIKYPDWVETYEDTFGCCFESGCTLGFDTGRPEDEPTKEELQEFDEYVKNLNSNGQFV